MACPHVRLHNKQYRCCKPDSWLFVSGSVSHFLEPAHKLGKIIRNVCAYVDQHKHVCTPISSIVTGVSNERTRCVCVWVYMRFVLRIQAWQCINDRILEGTSHAYTLLLSLERNTRTRIAPRDEVWLCIERNSYFPFSRSRSSLVSTWQQQQKKEKTTTTTTKYDTLSSSGLVDFLLSSCASRSPCALQRYLRAMAFSFSLLSTRFVDKRPSKRKGRPIEEKMQVIFSFLPARVFFFCSSSESNTQYPLLLSLLLLRVRTVSLSLWLVYLFLFVNLLLRLLAAHTRRHRRVRKQD